MPKLILRSIGKSTRSPSIWQRRKHRLVLDSRMAWHFVPNSFKIYLEVDPSIAADRLIGDKARSSERYPDFDSALRFLLQRRKLEHERFRRLYNVDDEDITNFDLVINSSLVSAEEIVHVIADVADKYEAASADRSVWLSPKLLIPTQNVRALANDDGADPTGEREADHPIEVIRWHIPLKSSDGTGVISFSMATNERVPHWRHSNILFRFASQIRQAFRVMEAFRSNST